MNIHKHKDGYSTTAIERPLLYCLCSIRLIFNILILLLLCWSGGDDTWHQQGAAGEHPAGPSGPQVPRSVCWGAGDGLGGGSQGARRPS